MTFLLGRYSMSFANRLYFDYYTDKEKVQYQDRTEGFSICKIDSINLTCPENDSSFFINAIFSSIKCLSNSSRSGWTSSQEGPSSISAGNCYSSSKIICQLKTTIGLGLIKNPIFISQLNYNGPINSYGFTSVNW